MKIKLTFFTLLFFFTQLIYAQDLLDLVKDDATTEKVHNAFKSPRVINNHSMEMLAAGALDFRILHRFGRIDLGYKEFFGLDNATMRMSFDYGIRKNLTVGIGRSTLNKEVDGFLKYRILWQSTGAKSIPLSVIATFGITHNGKDPYANSDVKVGFSRRLNYYYQLIIGRKFNDRFSFQISPILIHTNLVENQVIPNNLYAVGLGGRYKFSKRMAFVIDYTFPFNNFPRDYSAHPLSIGVDIETGGHVFQLHFSNAVGMNERALIDDDNGNWLDGEIQFGFNLSRIFQLRKNKI